MIKLRKDRQCLRSQQAVSLTAQELPPSAEDAACARHGPTLHPLYSFACSALVSGYEACKTIGPSSNPPAESVSAQGLFQVSQLQRIIQTSIQHRCPEVFLSGSRQCTQGLRLSSRGWAKDVAQGPGSRIVRSLNSRFTQKALHGPCPFASS